MKAGQKQIAAAAFILAGFIGAPSAVDAFSAGETGSRLVWADEVADTSAYLTWTQSVVHGASSTGYSNQVALSTTNSGPTSADITWVEITDTNNAGSPNQCSAPTAVDGACSITFSGNAKPGCSTGCTYTIYGWLYVEKANEYRGEVRFINITVKYCLSPPCA